MNRIFVAIDISEEARSNAAARIEALRGQFPKIRVGWEKPEKLHLTLKFAGDITGERLRSLAGAVGRVSRQISPFRLKLNKCGIFPSKRNARILWIGVEDPEGVVKRLNDMLEAECEKIDIARETRDFKPHLTIARLREPNPCAELAEKHLRTEFEPIEFGVMEIVIYESRLLPTGSIYTPVSRHKLTG
jgi:RNA 2',3'-cyclic 3'-phosphodiesterase